MLYVVFDVAQCERHVNGMGHSRAETLGPHSMHARAEVVARIRIDPAKALNFCPSRIDSPCIMPSRRTALSRSRSHLSVAFLCARTSAKMWKDIGDTTNSRPT
jgi:hypothetical protein